MTYKTYLIENPS